MNHTPRYEQHPIYKTWCSLITNNHTKQRLSIFIFYVYFLFAFQLLRVIMCYSAFFISLLIDIICAVSLTYTSSFHLYCVINRWGTIKHSSIRCLPFSVVLNIVEKQSCFLNFLNYFISSRLNRIIHVSI